MDDNKVLKEIEDFQSEKNRLEKSIEVNKALFIKEIKNGMGEKIKNSQSIPSKIKIKRITRFKRWLKKILQ